MNLAVYLPNLVEFPKPLEPGDRIFDRELRVLEVVRAKSVVTVAGEPRPVFIAIHEKRGDDGSMVTMFVSLNGEQTEWIASAGHEGRFARFARNL